jgi:hypothetical protein
MRTANIGAIVPGRGTESRGRGGDGADVPAGINRADIVAVSAPAS